MEFRSPQRDKGEIFTFPSFQWKNHIQAHIRSQYTWAAHNCIEGRQVKRIHEFYETLLLNVESLQTLQSLNRLDTAVRFTFDQLGEVKSELFCLLFHALPISIELIVTLWMKVTLQELKTTRRKRKPNQTSKRTTWMSWKSPLETSEKTQWRRQKRKRPPFWGHSNILTLPYQTITKEVYTD